MSEGYNGWTNYETWNVDLWAMNEEPTYRTVAGARDAYTPDSARALAVELFPDGTPDFDDMGGAGAFDRVDWEEITASWNEAAGFQECQNCAEWYEADSDSDGGVCDDCAEEGE